MIEVKVKAFAKINLSLDVTGVRPNGYHDVSMIMQTVGLCDELILRKNFSDTPTTDPENLKIEIEALPGDPDGDNYINVSGLSFGEDNLIYKAAKLFFSECKKKEKILFKPNENCSGVGILIQKNIPLSAGLAGGSTDAAATLRGLNSLFEAGFSQKELCSIGEKIGADVPFCIMGGTMLSEGIGEILTTLPPAPDCYVLIAKPDNGLSTKYVYDNLKMENLKHPDTEAVIDAIVRNDLRDLCENMGNVLETVAIPEIPMIAAMKTTMRSMGAVGSLMSGSGSSVFGLFSDEAKAKKAEKNFRLTAFAKETYLTKFVRV